MFANYLSRKNFSHTRANRRRNASPVGLPAALVSITSQEAASHGLCGLPPGRPAFSMKEVCGYLGVCSSQLGETVPGEPSRSSCVPGSPLLSSLPFSSLLLCLLPSSPPISSLPFPSYSSFSLSLNQSVENCCLTALLLPSQAHPRLSSQDHLSPAPSPPSPSYSPSSSQTWLYWIGREEVLKPLVSSSDTFNALPSRIHKIQQVLLWAYWWLPCLKNASGLNTGFGENSS